jgi:benzylsuccinate CoA-transferase BbsF subunit
MVGEWTQHHTPADVMNLMQTAGVPAGIVARGEDIVADPQLDWRRHFKTLDHREMGAVPYDELPFRFSETSCGVRKPAPCLGEDNDYVAREILGLSDEAYEKYKQKGAFE